MASYRIQLTPTFGFADTIGLLDHVVSLCVSHLYLSPIAEAAPGSLHGYDVIDHTRVRAEFGGEEGLVSLLDAAANKGLGVLIDHVPNHMSVAEADRNDRWWQMLRDGPSSTAATWFDVDWDFGGDRVIVPKLGDPLDRVLADGGLMIAEGDRGPELRYGPLRFPLAAGTEQLDVIEAVERQHYLLQWWRDPARNVRRFFAIDDLVAVRAERPEVAEVIDTIPVLLADHPAFAGVRVDHVDGLADPEAYLLGLRRRIGDGARTGIGRRRSRRMLGEIARDKHRHDRQHFLEQFRRHAAFLRGIGSNRAAAVLRSENLAENVVALIDIGRPSAENVGEQSAAAKRREDRAKPAHALRMIFGLPADPGEDCRKQRPDPGLGSRRFNSELARDRFDPAGLLQRTHHIHGLVSFDRGIAVMAGSTNNRRAFALISCTFDQNCKS